MAAGNVRGTNWTQAQDWAKKGKFGRAKQQVELGGGTWSKEMHRSLKSTGNYTPPTETTPDPAEELQRNIDKLIAQMNQQQINQQNAYNQQQAQLKQQREQEAAERERMRPKDVSQALGSTILSGGDAWKNRKKNWLQPFTSLLPGGN